MKTTILHCLLLLFLVGCGNTETEEILPEQKEYNLSSLPLFPNNQGNALNTYGYYGDKVYFGDQYIVGEWRGYVLKEDNTLRSNNAIFIFNSDGSGNLSCGECSGSGSDFTYGIDSNATQLTLKFLQNNTFDYYQIIGFDYNCTKILQTETFELLYGLESYLCKYQKI